MPFKMFVKVKVTHEGQITPTNLDEFQYKFTQLLSIISRSAI